MATNFHSDWVDGASGTRLRAADLNPALQNLDRAITYIKNVNVSITGNLTYNKSTGVLAWSGTIYFHFTRNDGYHIHNYVNAGSVTLGDDQFAYLDFSETSGASISMSVASIPFNAASTLVAYNRFIFAFRDATSDNVFLKFPYTLEGGIGPHKIKTKAVVSLGDTTDELTASQMVDSSIFTAAPTADRSHQVATAANIIAAIPGYQIGTWFEFTVVNTDTSSAANDVTLTTNTNITLVGNMVVVANSSGTFLALITSSSAVSIYRK